MFTDIIKIHISAELSRLLPVDTHVYDYRSFFYILVCYKLRLAHGYYQYVRLSAHLSQIRGFRVCGSDCGIFPEHQHTHRFSYDVAASHHNTFFACDLNTAAFQQLNDTGRCTGYEAGSSDREVSNIERMKTVHVLFGRNRQQYLILIYVLRHR